MQVNKEQNSLPINEENDTVNIREEIEKYIYHWKWFVLGVFLTLILAFLYLRYSTPEYSASASILIKDNQKSGISKELEAFKDMGIVGGGSSNNTDNEIEILKSRKIIGNVVDSLNLGFIYSREGRIKKSEIFGDKNPIILKLISLNKEFLNRKKDTSFSINFLSKNEFQLKNEHGDIVTKNAFDKVIKSDLGLFKIVRSTKFDETSNDIYISILTRDKVIDYFKESCKYLSC